MSGAELLCLFRSSVRNSFWLFSGFSAELFIESYRPSDGVGFSLVEHCPHFSLELGGDDDDTPESVYSDRDTLWRYLHSY